MSMDLEEYADVFVDIDEHGFLTPADKEYLSKKGVLKPKAADHDVTCPNCKSPLPDALIRRIIDLVVEEISSNREKFVKTLSESLGKASDKSESMMYR